jgi:hypothetical protein
MLRSFLDIKKAYMYMVCGRNTKFKMDNLHIKVSQAMKQTFISKPTSCN